MRYPVFFIRCLLCFMIFLFGLTSKSTANNEIERHLTLIEPVSFASVSNTFFNNEMQLVVNEKTGTIDKITAFRKKLVEQGVFAFVEREEGKQPNYRIPGDLKEKEFPREKTPDSCSLNGFFSIDGYVKLGQEEVIIKERLEATKEGIRIKMNYSASELNENTKGIFLFRLSEENFTHETFSVDGKKMVYGGDIDKEILSVDTPQSIELAENPVKNIGFVIHSASRVIIRREKNNGYVLELFGNKGNLDFTIVPPYPVIETTLQTDHLSNVFAVTESDSLALNYSLTNNLLETVPVNRKITIKDYDNNIVYNQEKSEIIKVGSPLSGIIKPKLKKKGFYTATIEVTDQKYNHRYEKFLTLGIIRPHSLDTPFNVTDYFGMFGIGGGYDGGRRTTLAKKMGVQWSRDECGMQYREPTKGKINWDYTDGALNVTERFKMGNLLWGENSGPDWALGDPVPGYTKGPIKDIEGWREFWQAKATRYAGRVQAWEVWNEVNGKLPIEECVQVHKIALEEVRKADPKAIVVANVGGFAPYLQSFLKAGGADACDAISVHPYGTGFTSSPEAGDIAGWMQKTREEIDKYKKGMPIWWTEWGWAANDHDDLDIPEYYTEPLRQILVPERMAANYCVRSHLIGLSEGVKHLFYFCLACDFDGWPFNILREEGIKPVLCAYNTMTWMLNGKEYLGKVKLEPDVYAMAFKGKDENVLAYWYGGTPEKSGKVSIPLKQTNLAVVNIMDNPEEVTTSSEGIIIPIDGGPRFIVSKSLDCKTLLSAFEKCSRLEIEGISKVKVNNVAFSDDMAKLEITLENIVPYLPSSPLVSGIIKCQMPQEWSKEKKEVAYKNISGGASRVLEIPFDSPVNIKGDTPYPLEIKTEDNLVLFQKDYIFIPVTRTEIPVNLDDNLTEWGKPLCILDKLQNVGTLGGNPSSVWNGKDDLSAEVYLKWDEEHLYLAALVKDDIHHQELKEVSQVWKSDSIQIGFDMNTDGSPAVKSWDNNNDYEFLAALTPDGPKVYPEKTPEDIKASLLKEVKVYANRNEKTKTTLYEIAFPWELLSPNKVHRGTTFGFNLIANDDDGNGRTGWIGITPGLGEGKWPGLFKTVLLI